jgi:hypothetical protein
MDWLVQYHLFSITYLLANVYASHVVGADKAWPKNLAYCILNLTHPTHLQRCKKIDKRKEAEMNVITFLQASSFHLLERG